MATIIKNISDSEILIEDLGIAIQSQEIRDIGILFKKYELQSSNDLLLEIENDNIIMNDGSKDLTKSQALSFFVLD